LVSVVVPDAVDDPDPLDVEVPLVAPDALLPPLLRVPDDAVEPLFVPLPVVPTVFEPRRFSAVVPVRAVPRA
jgi:hypothetical protein